jgi:hypothetical protein
MKKPNWDSIKIPKEMVSRINCIRMKGAQKGVLIGNIEKTITSCLEIRIEQESSHWKDIGWENPDNHPIL